MEQCLKLIQTNQCFQKSVNLQLDLGNYERIDSYIPTRSSTAILERYFAAIAGASAENATILIGPYGKGKSHLLLVLLSLLQGKSKENATLQRKIEKCVRGDGIKNIRNVMLAGKRYLPVLVNPTEGDDLNQTFLMALREALFREKLGHIAPDSYYSEAVRTIESWETSYPETYRKFENLLGQQGMTCQQFKRALEKQEKSWLEFFVQNYPVLTAGSVFAPMLQTGALKLYQQIGRILTEECGYDGIYIVFDEFSKYIEGHAEAGFANDMRTLQDMCELADNSRQELFLTLVAHKSIHEYVKGVPLAAKNAFRGVEGRLTEVEFVVSAQNNYELIADAVIKKEPEFSVCYRSLAKQENYHRLLEESWQLPCFRKLFSEEEFTETIAKGCFPMTPLFSYALLHVSEKIAQNERTIFTFLAGDAQGSLNWLLQKGQNKLIGIDKIYDYFKSLFRETVDQPMLHHEWMKAEDALEQAENEEEKAVIKAIAVLRMIHRGEELPVKEQTIRLALDMEEQKCLETIAHLKEKGIIVYRSSIGVYAFRSRVGVNVEKEIEKKAAEAGHKNVLCDVLKDVLEMAYELPRQYNQKYAITRYFRYVYMEVRDFLALDSSRYLFEEEFSDGKIILLIQRERQDKEVLQKHLEQWGDERVLLFVPEQPFALDGLLKKYQAVNNLMQDEKFIDGNRLLLQELRLYGEDIAFEINAKMEEAYLPENQKVWILQAGRETVKGESAAALSNLLSDICETYYSFSPKVNHELLNIQNVGTQYLRARNMVVKKLLEETDCSDYYEGTSPEAMVYRAAFVHTREDAGCQRVFAEIDDFFRKCAGNRVAFKELYARLYGKGYGVRKGIIPLFLAKKLADMEATAVIYVGKREMEVDYETLNKVNELPEKYELYIEQETAEKEQYLQELERIFCVERSYTVSKQGRVAGILRCMQNWYRSLPQYAMVTADFEADAAGKIRLLRDSLRRAEINPRELLFDKFPREFGKASYLDTVEEIRQCKVLLEQKLDILKKNAAIAIKNVFGAHADASLKACLVEWYRQQSVSSKNYIMSTGVNHFMQYLGTLETNDEGEIVARISRVVLDVYVEDWRDDTLGQFLEALTQMKVQIEDIRDEQSQSAQRNRIILKDAQGKEIEKYYDADTKDSTSMYLKNMMSETMEEFGDALEMNQKVAVLVEMLEELLQ